MSVTIPLTKGYVAIIDDEDAEKVMPFTWSAWVSPKRRSVYAIAHKPGKRTTIQMHRVIMDAKPSEQVDHSDGNGLNNCKANLRSATAAQNQANVGPRRDNTSGFKGVHWHKPIGKWIARISGNGKRIHVGCFTSAEEAARAYDAKAVELHGEFARPNFEADRLAA